MGQTRANFDQIRPNLVVFCRSWVDIQRSWPESDEHGSMSMAAACRAGAGTRMTPGVWLRSAVRSVCAPGSESCETWRNGPARDPQRRHLRKTSLPTCVFPIRADSRLRPAARGMKANGQEMEMRPRTGRRAQEGTCRGRGPPRRRTHSRRGGSSGGLALGSSVLDSPWRIAGRLRMAPKFMAEVGQTHQIDRRSAPLRFAGRSMTSPSRRPCPGAEEFDLQLCPNVALERQGPLGRRRSWRPSALVAGDHGVRVCRAPPGDRYSGLL